MCANAYCSICRPQPVHMCHCHCHCHCHCNCHSTGGVGPVTVSYPNVWLNTDDNTVTTSSASPISNVNVMY